MPKRLTLETTDEIITGLFTAFDEYLYATKGFARDRSLVKVAYYINNLRRDYADTKELNLQAELDVLLWEEG